MLDLPVDRHLGDKPEILRRKNLLTLPTTSALADSRGWSERHVCSEAFPSEGLSPGSAAPAVRVLLVDDHEDTNRSLSLLLGRRGYKVQAATSLASAEVLWSLEPSDVLVCDMNLPDGSGVELLGRLAAQPPRLGAIILSGYNTDEDIERSLAAGYKAHLGKPIYLDKLDAAIKRLGK